MLLFMAQQERTHHRRQGECDKAGNQHRPGQRQRKFNEQLAGTPGHESHRGVHGRQCQGHGNDSKTDFRRTLECGLPARHAGLDSSAA